VRHSYSGDGPENAIWEADGPKTFMWIVRLALNRPFTFIVMAMLIAILGVMTVLSTPTDVFPYINIPVASVIWSYTGMSPDDMAKRVLLISERAMPTTVNSIEHIESTSYNGVGLIRVTCSPGLTSIWPSRRS
jgi:multidrug efflux pump subunit AcrB